MCHTRDNFRPLHFRVRIRIKKKVISDSYEKIRAEYEYVISDWCLYNNFEHGNKSNNIFWRKKLQYLVNVEAKFMLLFIHYKSLKW